MSTSTTTSKPVLEGRVAVVTGAAHGLGRIEALELARHGARVVVSDLGTRGDGQGTDPDAANAVVEEIEQLGAEAVAHFGDVASWDDSKAMIAKAVEHFGGLDILVNNAGFCRDKMIFSMTEEDFDDVIRVHLKGHFCGMRHATEYWRGKAKAGDGQVYGRIINTSSEAFIFGSPGQPNYAAAKAGIVAMTGSAAQAMARYGVTANAIMPRARTRMTDHGPTAPMFARPEDGFDTFAPEHVGPLVAWLCSPASQRSTGNVFLVWGKQITLLSAPGRAADLVTDAPWTYEGVAEALEPVLEKREPLKDSFIVAAR
jgi:3-oxoacyl-[acyl-carrier protein] reductase